MFATWTWPGPETFPVSLAVPFFLLRLVVPKVTLFEGAAATRHTPVGPEANPGFEPVPLRFARPIADGGLPQKTYWGLTATPQGSPADAAGMKLLLAPVPPIAARPIELASEPQ